MLRFTRVISALALLAPLAMAFTTKSIETFRPSTLAAFATRASTNSPRVVSGEMLHLFNRQITRELLASQLYLSASIWCDSRDLVGMAAYMRRESDEERRHALSFIDFASKRGIPVRLENLGAPESDWSTPEELWEDILLEEEENTNSLLNLGDAAAVCHDHAVAAFLMPYHMEQVNAEDTLRTILSKVRDENKTPGLLRQLDTELGEEAAAK